VNLFTANDGRIRSLWRFVLAVFVTYFANVVAAGFAASAGYGRRFEFIYRVLALVLVLVGYSVLLVIADRVEENPLSAMGLSLRRPWLREAIMGLALGVTLIVIAAAALAVAGHLTFTSYLSYRTFARVFGVIIILAAGAMLEEAMFRGYPFQRLVESVGSVGAILILSGLFGAAHLANPHASVWGFINTVAVGVLLSLLYLRTRSLWMPWGFHFAWNLTLGLLLGLPVSGMSTFSVLIRTKAAGPVWLTGGRYGIEASAVGTAVIATGIILVLTLVKPSTPAVPAPSVTADLGGLEQNGVPAERIQLDGDAG